MSRGVLLIILAVFFGLVQTLNSTTDDYEAYEDDRPDDRPVDCQHQSMFSQLASWHRQNRGRPVVKQVSHLNETMQVLEHLANLTQSLVRMQIDRRQVSSLLELFYEANVSDQCLIGLALLLRALVDKQLWALKCK